jgi:hypothetical protein
MGKKRQLINHPQKYGHKHHAHPALANPAEEAPGATPTQATAAPKVKKQGPFKKLANKTKTKATDKE